ncbi:MAG: hypothetical protein COV10_02650 [Candidatus Vogelbacteria bacterium CG10_big_fil_rev_8_21_14_0_10_51_16]|uniref:Uncharacterized protein n=1 Tax=Candidatus Vogelbacteria bacterium CG10_big_fil_rev_8_21_14_0_10_51_16 TaxID=1975045 RepID=A0A2H0RDZ2_9BACT|nr:MAG: hypothetical protein COV10_02650 [Candidatus Vogelbacteria bacterium CG10_big_fil_rev_8_21_14_0_10_51_16]
MLPHMYYKEIMNIYSQIKSALFATRLNGVDFGAQSARTWATVAYFVRNAPSASAGERRLGILTT